MSRQSKSNRRFSVSAEHKSNICFGILVACVMTLSVGKMVLQLPALLNYGFVVVAALAFIGFIIFADMNIEEENMNRSQHPSEPFPFD
jgi:hypothetical protein